MKRVHCVWLPIALAFSALAEEESAVGLKPEHEGYGLYQQLCADCHGVRADGVGRRASEFQPHPPDLTQLRGLDGGAVRREDLARSIDGRRTLRAHGDADMPVWGWELLADVTDPETRERARQRLVYTLADYLVSIQQPEPEGDEEPRPGPGD